MDENRFLSTGFELIREIILNFPDHCEPNVYKHHGERESGRTMESEWSIKTAQFSYLLIYS